eukprot:337607_1
MAAVATTKMNQNKDVEMKTNDHLDDEELKEGFKELIAQNKKRPQLTKEVQSQFPDVVVQLLNHKPKYKINNKTGSVTFYPSPHLKQSEYGTKVFSKEPFKHSAQLQHFLSKIGCKSIESVFDSNAQIIKKNDSFHGFARAMEIAYFDHYPLRIKVSHIWLLIMHALAAHIDVNAEKLRSKYVNHDGKKELIVDRAGFVKGSAKNDWASVITEFAQQIDKNTVNDVAKILENDFSVTTDLERIASKVSLMAACKHYFNYVVRCGCGFREITLDGTKQDWMDLQKKVQLIFKDRVDQQWAEKWSKPLFDILDRFVDAYDGEIDCLFWNSMVRRGRVMSGMMIPNDDPSNINSYYSGWINTFFPYLNQMQRVGGGFGGRQSATGYGSNQREGSYNDPDGNSSFEENNASTVMYNMNQYETNQSGFHRRGDDKPLKKVLRSSCSLKVFPIGLANAPVTLKDVGSGKQWKLKFAAGFIG